MDVRTKKKDRVWTVIIDRPEARNAVNRQTADQLVEAFLQFDQDDHAAVAVLWGAGGTFCAGADLKAVAKISEGEHQDALQDEGLFFSCADLWFNIS